MRRLFLAIAVVSGRNICFTQSFVSRGERGGTEIFCFISVPWWPVEGASSGRGTSFSCGVYFWQLRLFPVENFDSNRVFFRAEFFFAQRARRDGDFLFVVDVVIFKFGICSLVAVIVGWL